MSEREECPTCGALDGNHSWTCSSAPAAWRAANFHKVVMLFNDRCVAMEQRGDRLVGQVTLWQGKFRIVAHENNQLRKRLRALEARVEALAEKKLELRL